jgi:hypothetical protein
MAQAYYTLDEAARMLVMNADELKQMARKGQIRSFQDRGTWRFRVQDIQELARQRGMGSDPELVPGDVPAPRPADSPAHRTPSRSRDAEVFDFSLDLDADHVGVGHENLGGPPGSGKRSDSKRGGPRSPAPKAGSDSDVRLVPEHGGPLPATGSESDVRLVQDAPSPRPSRLPPKSKSGVAGPSSPAPRSPKPGHKSGVPPSEPVDSGVRLVPLDSDSDVKIVGADSAEVSLGQQPIKSASDSDIRIQMPAPNRPAGSDDGLLTEEINLDEELQKGAPHTPQQRRSKVKPKAPSAAQALPSTSPFELSEADMNVPGQGAAPAASAGGPFEVSTEESSSDFDLTPAGESSSPIEPGTSEEFDLQVPDESPSKKSRKGPASGHSLQHPADKGISLEQQGQGAEDIDFELSLDAASTPKPAPVAPAADADSSEFELSLDADTEGAPHPPDDSSSEFELTLDDSGGLAPLAAVGQAQEDKDIFETDFDVPALEDESGSQAVALDEAGGGDLESSDFDLTLAADDESGSDVVVLDEGEAFPGAAEGEPGFEQLEGEPGEEVEEEPAVREKALPVAPWGALPVVFMLPCVIVLFLVGVMGFELVQSMVGHKPPGMVTKAVGSLLGQNMKQ